MRLTLSALASVSLLAATPGAQFNDAWVAYEKAPAAVSSAAPISDDDHETDLDWGDLDLDGDTDVVIARKQPFTTTGKRTNVLLVNESGVLTDRTALLASTSDFPGDLGFSTPTNDRDVVIADVTGNGWPDVITACGIGPGEPKEISHPRVYVNLADAGGNWQGLRYEESRIPQLLHNISGIPLTPRFMAVTAADFDNDGYIDLFFGDHDTGLQLFGATQPPEEDTDDRLLFNDQTGTFVDVTTAMMSPNMTASGFCNSVAVGDFNQDGAIDILKQASYQNPVTASIAYNDPSNPGDFVFFDSFHTGATYFVNTGDLNQDGRLDVVLTQNTPDAVRVNTGLSPLGAASWSPPIDFELLVGAKIGFTYSSNNLITDLDGDGWGDVLIADVDPEVPQYAEGFRTSIYHNRGGTIGGADIVLREERATVSDDYWVGAYGLTPADLRWTHDIGVFDVDGDGLDDLLLSRREGTDVWRQVAKPQCQPDVGAGNGLAVLEVCGGDLSAGSDATLRVFGGEPNASALLILGAGVLPTYLPEFDVTLVPATVLTVVSVPMDASGELALPMPGGLGAFTLVMQVAIATGGGFEETNAVSVTFQP